MNKMSQKSKKRFNRFMDSWLTKEEFKDWIIKKDDTTAGCRACNREFTVKHLGVSAVNSSQKQFKSN